MLAMHDTCLLLRWSWDQQHAKSLVLDPTDVSQWKSEYIQEKSDKQLSSLQRFSLSPIALFIDYQLPA